MTTTTNTKLYETSEVLRLTRMYNNVLAESLERVLDAPTHTEEQYRKAIADTVVVVKPHVPHVKPDITGRDCIINASTNVAYVLPDIEFKTGTYSTFEHTKLSQLCDEHRELIEADLRPSDILRKDQLSKAEQAFYRVVMLGDKHVC
ncbi:hypothetical protein [Vibrio jasicida]